MSTYKWFTETFTLLSGLCSGFLQQCILRRLCTGFSFQPGFQLPDRNKYFVLRTGERVASTLSNIFVALHVFADCWLSRWKDLISADLDRKPSR